MNINDKFVLVSTAPYHHFTGVNETRIKFIEVIIVKRIENIPYEFDPNEFGTGYLAKGSDGYMYGYDYPRYGGSWTRYIPDDKFDLLPEEEKDIFIEDLIWNDITIYQCPKKAAFCENLDYIEYCNIHQHHYYNRKGCFRCKHKMPPPKVILNINEHKWMDWY